MLPLRRLICMLLGMALVLAVALADPPPGAQPKPCNEPYCVTQEFPVDRPKGTPAETAWKVKWRPNSRKLQDVPTTDFYIQEAWFKKGPNEEWMKVLGDARVADIFVVYHGDKDPETGKVGNDRFWDVSVHHHQLLKPGVLDGGPAGGPPGVVLEDMVLKEVRDRGVIWKDVIRNKTRRGQELVLSGTLKVTNYAYITRYGFQDDGTVTFRIGATGLNYPQYPWVSHMHNAIWRIDVDLDGPEHNAVRVMRHREPKSKKKPEAKGDPEDLLRAEDDHPDFCAGKEGSLDWNPEEFTMLRVINTKKTNANCEPIAYDLMPMRTGTARHYGAKYPGRDDKLKYEECLLHDFWVTRSHKLEDQFDWEIDAKQLASYVNGEGIKDADVVLWYISSMHHKPRTEDGKTVPDEHGKGFFTGSTLLMWSGFDLRPANLFNGTPHYPYGEVR